MKHTLKFILAGCLVAGFSAAAAEIDWSKLPPAATKANVMFADDIQPILKSSCVRCHSAEHPKAQLRLDTLEGVSKGGKHGPVLKVGDSANSLIVKTVSQLDPEIAMPPKPHGHSEPGGLGGGFDRPPGTNASDMPPHGEGEPEGGDHGPGGFGGPGGPGPWSPRMFGPPPKPLTSEQVGLIRAWIDQGAK
jgi:Planctomycete cytochrome C